MSVVEKIFAWRVRDEATGPMERIKNVASESKDAATKAAEEVATSGDKWKEMATKAQEAGTNVFENLQKQKRAAEDYRDGVKQALNSAKEAVDLYEDKLKQVPKLYGTNFEVKVKDAELIELQRKINDAPKLYQVALKIRNLSDLKEFVSNVTKVPKLKEMVLNLKGNFGSKLKETQEQVDRAKHSFSDLKNVMSGTFLGGAILNGVHSITNGIKEMAAAGMEYDVQQQKMHQTWLTLTDDAGKAKGMVNTINDLAVKTGQSRDLVNELEQGFYHLHSSKTESDSLTKSMLNMGDAVGLTSEQMRQVEQDMVHGLATGKITQGELNQIGMYFPMIDEAMAKHFDTSVKGMRKMASAGKISAKDLEEVFNQLGSGKYSKAADNMMQSMWGMQRTIRTQTPALIGAFEKPFFNMKNPLYSNVSKWLLDPKTQTEFRNAGKVISDGINASITFTSDVTKPLRVVLDLVGKLAKAMSPGVFKGMGASFQLMGDEANLFAKALKAVFDFLGDLLKKIGKVTGLDKHFQKGTEGAKFLSSAIKAVSFAIGAFMGPMIAVKGAILGFATAAKVVRGTILAWDLVQKALNVDLALNPIGIAVVAITAFVAGIVYAYNHCKTFRDAVNKLGKDLKNVFTGKAGWEKSLVKSFQNAKKSVQNYFKDQAKEQQKAEREAEKQRQKHYKELAKLRDKYERELKKAVQDRWKDIKKYAQNGMNNTHKTIENSQKAIEKSWDRGWKAIGKFFSNIWHSIKNTGHGGMNSVKSVISSSLNKIDRLWRSAWNGLKNFFIGIWNDIKAGAQAGMNGVISVINAGIGAINKVWSFFTGHNALGKLSKVHFAQGGVVHRHLSVINDGEGTDWKELVQMPSGELFMSQERNWTGYLPEGARVYSGPETREIMNAAGIDHYATGGIVGGQHFASGGIVGKAVDWAMDKLDDITSWFGDKFEMMIKFMEHPVQATKQLLDNATSGMYGGLKNFGKVAHGTMNKLTNPIADWFKREVDKLVAQMENGSVSSDLVRLAAAKMHVKVSSGDIAHILNVIQHESGGKSGAQNNWDSNAKAGHPSKGVLQFIDSTFRKYAVAGYGNIWRPFDQLLAMFNDTTWRSDLTLGGWGPTGARRMAHGGEVLGLTRAILGDNPEGHEFVLNPYDVNAEPLMEQAFETTASAQPTTSRGTSQGGNSKLDRMIELLEQLVQLFGDFDLQPVLMTDDVRKAVNKQNAQRWSLGGKIH